MSRPPDRASEHSETELGALLEHIKNSRGFDFSGYRRSSLERRIAKRLEAVQIGSYSDYQADMADMADWY